ncbi:MAG: IS66 family insertion sequence element accessory protein TnpB [Opitutaceae bacterium]
MLAFPAGLRIFLALEAVDMRKQFNRLWAVASEKLREDPKSGAVFAFTNKKRDRLEAALLDGTGVWVLAKRLEAGRFQLAQGSHGRQACDESGSLDHAHRRNRP